MKKLLTLALLTSLVSCGGSTEEAEQMEEVVTTETADQVKEVQDVEEELNDLQAELDSLTQDL